MNNKAHLRPQDYDSNGDIIPMSMKEEKCDLISRSALKKAICIDEPISIDETWEQLYDAVVKAIDNAPTVNPCNNCDLYFKAMTKEIDRWYRKEEQKGGAEK